MSADDSMLMPQLEAVDMNDLKFKNCIAFGCSASSAFSQYPAITLRAGFDTCVEHTTIDTIASKASNTIINENTVFIFYDIDVTSNMEIAQLAASSTTNKHFSTVVRTSTRRNNSPIINKFSPMSYMLVATEPRIAFERFILWVNIIMAECSRGTASDTDVVLVAHNGMCHDHVVLFKTMIMWGIDPPKWRLSDSLPIFKLVIRPGIDESSKLGQLASEYAAWFMHVQHDALSDATALKHVVSAAVPDWKSACYVFSSSYKDFITSVGLNVYKVKTSLPFPTVDD